MSQATLPQDVLSLIAGLAAYIRACRDAEGAAPLLAKADALLAGAPPEPAPCNPSQDAPASGCSEGGAQDPLYDTARTIVQSSRHASISGLQRRLRIGYNRADRMIQAMESEGLISAPDRVTGARTVLREWLPVGGVAAPSL